MARRRAQLQVVERPELERSLERPLAPLIWSLGLGAFGLAWSITTVAAYLPAVLERLREMAPPSPQLDELEIHLALGEQEEVAVSRVADVERSVRFYADVLGFDVTKRMPRAAFLKIPGSADGFVGSGSESVVCHVSAEFVNGSTGIVRKYFSVTSASRAGGYAFLSA